MQKIENLNLTFSKNTLNPIVNKQDFKKLFKNKTNIDRIRNWHIYRNITNEFELVQRQKLSFKPISRAYFKLWEILKLFEDKLGLFDKNNINIATLAEAPGGFAQALQHYRKKFANNDNDKIYGISLKDGDNKTGHNIEWKLNTDNFHISFGDPENKDHDGNLINPDVLNYYIELFKNKKAKIATADGGFLIPYVNENFKESYHIPLFYSEMLAAVSVLEKGGSFIFKIYDISIKPMFDILYIINKLFKNVNIIKPLTSRPANSEKYIVATGFKGLTKYNKKMLFNILEQLWKNENSYKKKYIKSFIDIKYDTQFMKNIVNLNSKYLDNQNKNLEETIGLIRLKKTDLDNLKNKNLKNQKEIAEEFIKFYKIS